MSQRSTGKISRRSDPPPPSNSRYASEASSNQTSSSLFSPPTVTAPPSASPSAQSATTRPSAPFLQMASGGITIDLSPMIPTTHTIDEIPSILASLGTYISPEEAQAARVRYFERLRNPPKPRPPTPPPKPGANAPPPLEPPSVQDVIRYRYHFGVNLSSVYVLVRLLSPHMFPSSAVGDSELSAAYAWVQEIGLKETREKFEHHWANSVTDDDIKFLVTKTHLYVNAWTMIKSFIARCYENGMGVLIDLHGLPGGANIHEHSGISTKKSEFWSNPIYRQIALRCITTIATEVRDGIEGVIGIQIVNEASPKSYKMLEFYEECVVAASQIDCTIPLYVSDAWDLKEAVEFTSERNSLGYYDRVPICIDTHRYFCFSDAHRKMNAAQIADEAGKCMEEILEKSGNVVAHGAYQVYVGEYSCSLSEDTWRLSKGSRAMLLHNFGLQQTARWLQLTCGSAFWTFTKLRPSGWNFVTQFELGNLNRPESITLPPSEVMKRRDHALAMRHSKLEESYKAHKNMWVRNVSAHSSIFERYKAGYDQGYMDQLAFFSMRAARLVPSPMGFGADTIGCSEIWILKRLREFCVINRYTHKVPKINERHAAPWIPTDPAIFVWEFELGMRKGMEECLRACKLIG